MLSKKIPKKRRNIFCFLEKELLFYGVLSPSNKGLLQKARLFKKLCPGLDKSVIFPSKGLLQKVHFSTISNVLIVLLITIYSWKKKKLRKKL